MEVLLTKPVVVALAVLGALCSMLASVLQKKGVLTEQRARILNYAGYGFMGASMLLFILAGLRGALA